jgi:hypothetical protein
MNHTPHASNNINAARTSLNAPQQSRRSQRTYHERDDSSILSSLKLATYFKHPRSFATLQRASHRALKSGKNIPLLFPCLRLKKRKSSKPVREIRPPTDESKNEFAHTG